MKFFKIFFTKFRYFPLISFFIPYILWIPWKVGQENELFRPPVRRFMKVIGCFDFFSFARGDNRRKTNTPNNRNSHYRVFF